jgi:hypothetical protein
MKVTLKAATRLQAKDAPALNEGQYSISMGANSFQCESPRDAYVKAADFIRRLEHDGYKFTRRGVMSDKLDVYKKGTTEISVGVLGGVLKIDLWT